jgi:LEA14-like dessication related protein
MTSTTRFSKFCASISLPAITLCCAMLAVSGCAATVANQLQPPTVELINIQPQSLREGKTLMALTRLRVSNPNSIAVPIQGGRIKMTLAGTPVAEGDLLSEFTVPANGSEEIDIRINLDLASSLTLGMNLLAGETELPYRLDGYVDIGVAYLGRVEIVESGLVSLNQLRPGLSEREL